MRWMRSRDETMEATCFFLNFIQLPEGIEQHDIKLTRTEHQLHGTSTSVQILKWISKAVANKLQLLFCSL